MTSTLVSRARRKSRKARVITLLRKRYPGEWIYQLRGGCHCWIKLELLDDQPDREIMVIHSESTFYDEERGTHVVQYVNQEGNVVDIAVSCQSVP